MMQCQKTKPGPVTFLLGAEASAQVLPTQAGVEDRLKWWIGNIRSELAFLRFSVRLRMQCDFKRLRRVIKKHSSVDHYIAQSKPTGKVRRRILRAYALFWLLEQRKNGFDPRYREFVRKCVEPGNDPQEGCLVWRRQWNILNWNYDIQFEMAVLAAFSNSFSDKCLPAFRSAIDAIARDLCIQPWVSLQAQGCCRIFKLNGTAGINERSRDSKGAAIFGTGQDRLNLILDRDQSSLKERLDNYPGEPVWQELLEFATEWWRDPEKQEAKIGTIAPLLESTTTLVVIGYSFFEDNELVDAALLCRMRNLEKIYLQVPGSQVNDIESRLRTLLAGRSIPVEWKEAIGQPFFTPN